MAWSSCRKTSSNNCSNKPPHAAPSGHFADVGLEGDDAAHDIRELRDLLDAFNTAKRTAWLTVIKIITTGFVLALIAGALLKIKIIWRSVMVESLIDDIIRREGGFVNHPADRGGPTKYGITAKTLGNWRQLGWLATSDEVATLTESEAREIYRHRYILAPGF